jgi:hypothetical protein
MAAENDTEIEDELARGIYLSILSIIMTPDRMI